jgi:Zn ribbon nucleic-acid-binding protein
MRDVCPKCSNNSFKITTSDDGAAIAECLKCGAVTVFANMAGDSEAKPATAATSGNGAH